MRKRIERFPVIDLKATGENIKSLMRQRRLTVKEIQDYLRLNSLQSIYHWLSGLSLPTVDNLYALSELFCVSIDSIIKGNRREAVSEITINSDSIYKRLLLYNQKMNTYKAG